MLKVTKSMPETSQVLYRPLSSIEVSNTDRRHHFGEDRERGAKHWYIIDYKFELIQIIAR